MSNPINDGGAAFPCHTNPMPGELANAPQGMSLRDYFAAAALQGILANPGYSLFQADEQTIGDIADHAGRIANVMLSARTKGGQYERA